MRKVMICSSLLLLFCLKLFAQKNIGATSLGSDLHALLGPGAGNISLTPSISTQQQLGRFLRLDLAFGYRPSISASRSLGNVKQRVSGNYIRLGSAFTIPLGRAVRGDSGRIHKFLFVGLHWQECYYQFNSDVEIKTHYGDYKNSFSRAGNVNAWGLSLGGTAIFRKSNLAISPSLHYFVLSSRPNVVDFFQKDYQLPGFNYVERVFNRAITLELSMMYNLRYRIRKG